MEEYGFYFPTTDHYNSLKYAYLNMDDPEFGFLCWDDLARMAWKDPSFIALAVMEASQ